MKDELSSLIPPLYSFSCCSSPGIFRHSLPLCSPNTLHQDFSTLDLLAFHVDWLFAMRCYVVHCRIFSSIFDLYPLDKGNNILPCPPPQCYNQKCLHTLLSVSWAAKPPLVKNTALLCTFSETLNNSILCLCPYLFIFCAIGGQSQCNSASRTVLKTQWPLFSICCLYTCQDGPLITDKWEKCRELCHSARDIFW